MVTSPSPARRWRRRLIIIAVLAVLGAAALIVAYRGSLRSTLSEIVHHLANDALRRWFDDPASRAELATAFDAPCPGYPFLVPSAGLVGGLPWNAAYGPYNVLNPHPGIDIFGLGTVGTIPVYAAYDGLLTREDGWISAVIVRHDDPLHPGQPIWTYYTHMADLSGAHSFIEARFPPGSEDIPVRQGDLLGHQGIYNGGVNASQIGLHVHFSIVGSDLLGHYLNESVFGNTLDPTPYLGLALNNPPGDAFPLRCLPPAEER